MLGNDSCPSVLPYLYPELQLIGDSSAIACALNRIFFRDIKNPHRNFAVGFKTASGTKLQMLRMCTTFHSNNAGGRTICSSIGLGKQTEFYHTLLISEPEDLFFLLIYQLFSRIADTL